MTGKCCTVVKYSSLQSFKQPLAPLKFQQLYFLASPHQKKDVAEIGVSNHSATKAAVFPQNLRLHHFCFQFLAARMGELRLRRFSQECPVRQPVRAAAPNWR